MADPQPRDSRPFDLLVLAILAADVVLLPPDLRFFSASWIARPGLPGDALSGIATALGVLVIAAYAALAAAARPRAGAKLALVSAFAVLFVALPMASDMAARHTLGIQANGRYVSFPHDGGVLQTEAAMDFLLAGRNPYDVSYHDTEMARSHHSAPALWHALGLRENPAFSFYPYPPLPMIASLPLRIASKRLMGWYDQRFAYLLALVALAIAACGLTRDPRWRAAAVAALMLGPWQVPFAIQGYNDVVCVLFLIAMAVALVGDRPVAAGVWLALACASKQFAWLGVPLYFAWLIARDRAAAPARKRPRVRPALAFAATAAAFILPFLAWNPRALFRALITAQSQEYPFRAGGLGLANLLIAAGWVREPFSSFPIGALQILGAALAIAWGVRGVLRGGGAPALLRAHALAVLAFVFCSRHFAPNYLALPIALYLSATIVEESASAPLAPHS